MRKFPKQIISLTLGLILLGSMASQANAGSHSKIKKTTVASANCSPSANGPLEASSSYAFQALGADLTATVPKNVATSTLVGSFVTDAKGCPTSGYLAINDNGFVCTSTFTSFIVEGSPNNTGTMTWTSPCTVGPLGFVYASASGFSDVLYFSSNGTDVFTFAGKAQENLPIKNAGSGGGDGDGE
jgi:hypothetical protein